MCRASGRRKFYEKVLEDFEATDKTLSTAKRSQRYVVIEIGAGMSKRKRLAKKTKSRKQIGYRSFHDLEKLERFLVLADTAGYWKKQQRRKQSPPDWSKRGLCQYDKAGYIAIVKKQGDRTIGETILKRYTFKRN